MIKHQKSPDFLSAVASNVTLVGPGSDGLYHIIFYTDSYSINTETTKLTETTKPDENNLAKATYKTAYTDNDIDYFREDKVKIALPLKSISNLRDLLIQKLPSETKETAKSDDSA